MQRYASKCNNAQVLANVSPFKIVSRRYARRHMTFLLTMVAETAGSGRGLSRGHEVDGGFLMVSFFAEAWQAKDSRQSVLFAVDEASNASIGHLLPPPWQLCRLLLLVPQPPTRGGVSFYVLLCIAYDAHPLSIFATPQPSQLWSRALHEQLPCPCAFYGCSYGHGFPQAVAAPEVLQVSYTCTSLPTQLEW